MTEDQGTSQVARWQEKIDREFPNGMVAAFVPGTGNYLIPRVTVVRMAGLDPVVWFPVFSESVKTFGPVQVLSYEQIRSSPHRAVKVKFDNMETMVWSAAVSPEVARTMAGDRARYIAHSPHGGERVLKGDPE